MSCFYSRKTLLFLVLIALVIPQISLAADGAWESFEINAQYRGGVKKGFEELGCAIGYFVDLADGKKQVIFHSCVRNPQKKKEFYTFRVNAAFLFTPGLIKTDQEIYSKFEGFENEQQDQIKDMLALLSVIRDGSLIKMGNGTLRINKNVVKVSSEIVGGGKRCEFLVIRPGKPQLEGKFFLEKNAAGQWALDKFRFKRGKIVVSFVTADAKQVQSKYKNTPPFDQAVFGK